QNRQESCDCRRGGGTLPVFRPRVDSRLRSEGNLQGSILRRPQSERSGRAPRRPQPQNTEKLARDEKTRLVLGRSRGDVRLCGFRKRRRNVSWNRRATKLNCGAASFIRTCPKLEI